MKKENENEIKELLKVLKALASELRLKILLSLTEGEKNYTTLGESIGIKTPKGSGRYAYHLRMLLEADLINIRGRKYALTPKGEGILNLFHSKGNRLNIIRIQRCYQKLKEGIELLRHELSSEDEIQGAVINSALFYLFCIIR